MNTATELFAHLSRWTAQQAISRLPRVLSPESKAADGRAQQEAHALKAWAQELRLMALWSAGQDCLPASIVAALRVLQQPSQHVRDDQMRVLIRWAYGQSVSEAERLQVEELPGPDLSRACKLWVHLQEQAGGMALGMASRHLEGIVPQQDAKSLLFTQQRLILDLFDLVRAL